MERMLEKDKDGKREREKEGGERKQTSYQLAHLAACLLHSLVGVTFLDSLHPDNR